MRVYFDVISGDEMLSDSYAIQEIYDGAAFEVPSRMITKGGEEVDIGRGNQFGGGDADEAVDDTQERVNDIMDGFKLSQVGFTKKEYATYIRAYMGRIKKHLEATDADRVAGFMAGASALVKWIMGNFSEFEFYNGESFNQDAMIVLGYYKQESDETPPFIFIKDGLREEKF